MGECQKCKELTEELAFALNGLRRVSEAFDQQRDENCGLHLALFHAENGLDHPDEEVRLLIKAAKRARAIELGEIEAEEASDD